MTRDDVAAHIKQSLPHPTHWKVEWFGGWTIVSGQTCPICGANMPAGRYPMFRATALVDTTGFEKGNVVDWYVCQDHGECLFRSAVRT